MSLDEILDNHQMFTLRGGYWADEAMVKHNSEQTKKAILTDLLEMLQDEYLEKYVSSPDKELRNIRLEKRRWANLRNQLRQELRDKVRKYCE